MDINSDTNNLTFIPKKINPSIINKITITGNDITKDSTIRSKIPFEPGDYLNSNLIKSTKNDLLKFAYINSVDISSEIIDKKSDINIKINENKKTGQALFGGSFSGDSGAGIALLLKIIIFLEQEINLTQISQLIKKTHYFKFHIFNFHFLHLKLEIIIQFLILKRI